MVFQLYASLVCIHFSQRGCSFNKQEICHEVTTVSALLQYFPYSFLYKLKYLYNF